MTGWFKPKQCVECGCRRGRKHMFEYATRYWVCRECAVACRYFEVMPSVLAWLEGRS